MKILSIGLILAIGAALSPIVAAAHSGGSGSGSTGGSGGAHSGGTPTMDSKKVTPGMEHENGDTDVANQNTSGNKCISVSPAHGDGDSSTTIQVDSSVTCTMTGIDSNDRVSLGSNVNADVTCSGGTIEMAGGGSTLTLRVTRGPGSVSARVKLNTGGTVFVAPGSTVVFQP